VYNQEMHERIAERLSSLREASDHELNQVEEAIERAKAYAEAILEEAREPLLVLDQDFRVISVNRSFCQSFKVSPEEVEDHPIFEANGGLWNIPGLHDLLSKRLATETRVQDFEMTHDFPEIGQKILLVNACHKMLDSKPLSMILLAFQDVTERKKAEGALGRVTELLASNDELQKEVAKLKGAVEVHLKGREAAETQLKKSSAELKTANERLEKSAAERRQAEEEVHSLEELVENVFQSIQDRLVAFNRDFRVSTRSKAGK
jgi:PAS domain S-box-containing protein